MSATGSTPLTRWGAPLLLVAIGAGLSIAVAVRSGQGGPVLGTGVLSGLPVLAMVVLLLVRATAAGGSRTGDLVTTLLVAFLIGLHILLVAVGIGLTERLESWVPLLTAVLFLALAPTIATLEPGSPMGLRVKATLADPAVWRAAHVKLGLAFAAAAILGVACSIFAPEAAVLVTGGVPLAALVVLAVTARAPREQPPPTDRPSGQSGVDDRSQLG